MEQARALLSAFWEPFSLFALAGAVCLGMLLGGIAGLVLALQLQRRGWLGRRHRWYHWLLKLYFLLLPLAGGFLGFQGGLLYGGQQQIYRHLDAYAPLVQQLADDVWLDFQGHLAAQDQTRLEQSIKDSTVQDVLNQMALDFIASDALVEPEQLAEAGMVERAAVQLMERFRASVLSKALGKMVVEEAAKYSHLDKRVLTQALDARIEQLFQADFLLGLLKQQIGGVFKPFYWALLIQLGLLLASIGLEILLARRFRLVSVHPITELAAPQTA